MPRLADACLNAYFEDELNRPMLESDLKAIRQDSQARAVRRLVGEYRSMGLPVLNGSFLYSNFLEGPAQILTCNPYRLWEYSTLLRILADGNEKVRFIDVGGAGSPISYFLAETGHSGVVADLQPNLVDLCNHVAGVKGLNLRAIVGDIAKGHDKLCEGFDLAIFISVLEHIQVADRLDSLRSIHKLLRHGGLLYMTFDYGSYAEMDTYRGSEAGSPLVSESIGDIEQICGTAEKAGFRFVGNDPRVLPTSLLAQRSSPGFRDILWQYSMNIGVVDAETKWKDLLKYLLKRVLRIHRNVQSRFRKHNFFRVFLEKT